MQQERIGRGRHAALFGFGTITFVLALASTAFACVTFMGQMTVDGHDGDTTVVGKGNAHGYCTTGKPTTAAAGHLNDALSVSVRPGACNDLGALPVHQLPAGTYEVRYNNEHAYNFDGTTWNMSANLGCFLAANADTTSTIGSFQVDLLGNGSWSGPISPIDGAPAYSGVGNANNLCIGNPATGLGMLAPYRMLAI